MVKMYLHSVNFHILKVKLNVGGTPIKILIGIEKSKTGYHNYCGFLVRLELNELIRSKLDCFEIECKILIGDLYSTSRK